MKFCPVCQTKYDEEILRFCIKDGAPLIDEKQPDFKEMPSQDDLGEDTVIRRKPTKSELDALKTPEKESEPAKIVIPTVEQERQQQVRARSTAYQQPLPPQRSTGMLILTTVVLTLVGLAALGGIIWLLRGSGEESNSNVNVNTTLPNSMNINTNFGVNVPTSNFDYNTNSNANFNTNFNFNLNTNSASNLKTPTPTKTPTPSPSPSPSPSVSPSPSSTANMTTPTPVKTPTPGDAPKTPAPTPVRTPTSNSSLPN